MQPSAKWKTISPFINATTGINARTGATDFSNADFTNYPPFTVPEYTGAPEQTSNMFWWYTNGDFPLNTAIDDWSIAYTAVDNSELSLNNIGVFMSNSDTPAFYTNNREHAPIAFYTSLGYKVLYDNVAGVPFLNDAYRFKNPPYSDSRYVWSPNAGGATYEGNLPIFYRDANTEGYAAMFATFGIKSLFLEIRVRPVNISGDSLVLQDYSLKEYAAFTEQQRLDNPISMAYCMVHRRAATDGTYSQVNSFYTDINLVMGTPLKGYSSDIYTYFNNVKETSGIETLYLPLWGIPYKGRANNYIRYCDSNYSDPKGQNTSDFFYGYNKVDGTIVQNIGGGEYRYTKYMSGTEDNIEYLRRCAAAYGLFFCDDLYTSENKSLESSEYESDDARWIRPEMHLGIIEDDGYTRGNYTSGSDNANQSQFDWTDSTDSIYNPDVPPIPTENEYSHATVFNSIGDLATLTKRYVLNDSDIQLLGTELFKVTDDIFTQYSDMKDYVPKINSAFLTNNPLDCIVSLQKYPIEIPKAATPENIRLGSIQTNALGYKFDAPCLTFLFGGKPIFPRFGNSFLDYNPFTRFEIYVPFCGTVDLNPADILNRVLNVELIVDMSTGTCTGYIESDDLVIETVNGNLAIDIPVSGIDAATVNANLNNAAVNARTAFNNKRANSGLMSVSNNVGIMDVLQPWKWGGKATSMTASSLNSGYAAQKANYDLMHTQAPVHVIGSVSPVGAWAIDLNCRLLVYYPTGNIFDLDSDGLPVFNSKLSQFGALQGFATAETGNLNQYKGLTIAVEPRYTNMHTNSTTNPRALSADELDLITAALSEGIINNIS